MTIVTLYSKPGCHLCDDVRTLLEELRLELPLSIDDVDISGDAALFARYRHEIPVVAVNGIEIGRGRIDEAQLIADLSRAVTSP